MLRVGRQELNYGSGRLVSVREGSNVRQSFDGVRSEAMPASGKLTRGPFGRTSTSPDSSTTSPDHRNGILGSLRDASDIAEVADDLGRLLSGLKIERMPTYDRGRGYGTPTLAWLAAWRAPSPRKSQAFDFDYEGVVQFGSFGSDDIRAWTSRIGYWLQFLTLSTAPTIQHEGRYFEWRQSP